MSRAEFERIRSKYPSLREGINNLERSLAKIGLGKPVRSEKIADFVDLTPGQVEVLLTAIVAEDIAEAKVCPCCPQCDSVIESDPDEYGQLYCDACSVEYKGDQVNLEKCYYLKQPIVISGGSGMNVEQERQMSGNTFSDISARKLANISPWETLSEHQYTISITTLNDSPRKQALSYLQEYGIVRLRWQGDPPSLPKLASLEAWIGPLRPEQNDFVGKVKPIRPKEGVTANTGESAERLAPHVDGTQDERTPAVLAFQYDNSATWGAESTFYDMAGLFSSLPEEELERALTVLARHDCATCTKTKGDWTKTFNGPLIRSEYNGQSISIRIREDDLMKVKPQFLKEFEYLKSKIAFWAERHVLRYSPHEGDIVIFDNWRVLHGREKVGGRHQRYHDRIWIDSLAPEHKGQYVLGIRPANSALAAAIQQANRKV